MAEQPGAAHRRVIRTHEDFYGPRGIFPPGPSVPRLPIPRGFRSAAAAAAGTRKPITVTCDGRKWTVTPDEGLAFADWIDLQLHRAMREAMPPRGRGGPAIDWWGMLDRLVEAIDGGDVSDVALERLRKQYGIQSLAEAHRWLKAQRQASTARLRELDRDRVTGNTPEWERIFHETILRAFPPRRPGRPRKSDRVIPE
jgi:hypothetical protein